MMWTRPATAGGFSLMIEDCHSSNPIFGNMLNRPVLCGSAMPNGGTYVEGLTVWSTAPAVSSSKMTLSWLRLTTGGGNISRTGWTAVVATSF